MTTTTRSAEDDSQQANSVAADRDALGGGESLLGGTVAGDVCEVCGSRMAPDQRYCVECGTRRGKPRFSLQPAARAESGVEPVAARPRRVGWTSSTTLLAGIATLLLALGVGVLIGESGSSTPKPAGIHVVVNGGGGSSSGGATSTPSSSGSTGSSSTSSGSSHSSGSKTKAKSSGSNSSSHTASTPKSNVAPAASSGVSKSVTKTPAVKPGGSCTAGSPGCQGGKETGNFFP